MANVTFDKKQLPQVAALGALSACLFGYFGFKMLASRPPRKPPRPLPQPDTLPRTGTGASATATGASSSRRYHERHVRRRQQWIRRL